MSRTKPIAASALALLGVNAALAQESFDLLDLSIEELGQIQVTSVSRRTESLNDAAAAVYVISREDIRRSGVRSLPEALRLAPGVEVARNNAHSWTISMRGFNSDLSNKLLVLIDGRSVYSPLYGGVFWDAQHTFLHDIERIEVIAGPGGTMWGANAVNGVINIITRSSWDTAGGRIQLGRGNELEAHAGLRYSGRIGENAAARVYAQYTDRDGTKTATLENAPDEWQVASAGFRIDWDVSRADALTLQGDAYAADEPGMFRPDFTLGTPPGANVPGKIDIDGFNLLARWERLLRAGGMLTLHGHYDRTERRIPFTFDEKRHTFDVDFQHQLAPLNRHELMWGAELRVTDDDVRGTRFSTFEPPSRRDRTYSLFLQDEIKLRRDLFLTLGSKMQRNDYTGTEHQPNARVSWLPTDRQTLWAALSRAVRVPARLNEDLVLYAPVENADLPFPAFVNVVGDERFASERLIAREIGYRVTARTNLGFDLSLFEHDYHALQTNELAGTPTVFAGPPPYLLLPFVQGNGMQGVTRGGTLSVSWDPLEHWRLKFHYSAIDFDLDLEPGSTDDNATSIAGNSPDWQAAVHSYVDLPKGVSLYTGIRHVEALPSLNVPSYLAVDLSLDWAIAEDVKASLTVRNLNDEHHIELGGNNVLERSAYLMIDWAF